MAIMKSELQRLLTKYQQEAATTKSKRRSEVYHETARELQKILDGKKTFWGLHSLYADKVLFEFNPTKLKALREIHEDFKNAWVD
jgi:hypothetical protein